MAGTIVLVHEEVTGGSQGGKLGEACPNAWEWIE